MHEAGNRERGDADGEDATLLVEAAVATVVERVRRRIDDHRHEHEACDQADCDTARGERSPAAGESAGSYDSEESAHRDQAGKAADEQDRVERVEAVVDGGDHGYIDDPRRAGNRAEEAGVAPCAVFVVHAAPIVSLLTSTTVAAGTSDVVGRRHEPAHQRGGTDSSALGRSARSFLPRLGDVRGRNTGGSPNVVALLHRHAFGVLLTLVVLLVLQAALGGGLLRSPAPLLAVALVACALGSLLQVRLSLLGWAIAAAGMTVANQLDPSTRASALNDLVFFAGVVGAPIVLGHVLGARASQLRELDTRTKLLAASQDVAVAAARAEEHARLEREVHAAIAQRVGEIALQAGGAERMATIDRQRALEALARVEAAARASLDDIRQIIGVLRDPSVGGPG